MQNIADIISKKELKKDVRNTYEFQAYGNRLAHELDDEKRRSLYIKMAKNEDRDLLEQAREFVVGQDYVTTKGRLFMWRFSQLKKEKYSDGDK